MAKNEVAVKNEGSAVAILDDSLLEFGTGLEQVTPDDVSIPYIQVLQALSPQLNKNDGKYIKGAEQGNIYDSVLNTAHDGDEGIIVVPCYYNKKYIEWSPRETGGGKVNEHDTREILAQCTRNDRGQMVLSNGNYIAETAQFFVMICNEDETEWTQGVVSMTSTQLPKAKKWIAQMRQRRVKDSNGNMVDAPMFLFKYRMKTVAEQNDRGSWYGWSIGLEGPTTNRDMAKEATSFLKMIKDGEVKVKDPEDSPNTGGATVVDDDVPF